MQLFNSKAANFKKIMAALVSTMTVHVAMAQHMGWPQDNHGIGNVPGDNQPGWQQPCDNPYDSNCSQQPGNGRDDDQDKEVLHARVGRVVRNERLNLKWYLGDLQGYRDWQIERVVIEGVNQGYEVPTVSLLVAGRAESVERSVESPLRLKVRNVVLVGGVNRSLELVVQGAMHIEKVRLVLKRQSYQQPVPQPLPPGPQPIPQPWPQPVPPPVPQPPQWGQQVVDLGVSTMVYASSQIDLTRFIDVSRWRGYRVLQVIINGRPMNNVSLIDVLANGAVQSTVQFDRQSGYQQRIADVRSYTVIDYNMRLWLNTRGDMSVDRVQLLLSR